MLLSLALQGIQVVQASQWDIVETDQDEAQTLEPVEGQEGVSEEICVSGHLHVLPRETPWAVPGSHLPSHRSCQVEDAPEALTHHLLPVLHISRWDVTRPRRLQ